MGTNFYKVKKLSKENKEQIISFLNEDKYDEIFNLLPQKIHIGKRSGGWTFLWNVHDFKYFLPSKTSLFEWLQDGDIYDEYGTKYSFEKFINEEVSWNGLDIQSYYEKYPEYEHIPPYNKIIEFGEVHNVDINIYGEFYIDNLRCTYCNDFS